MKRIIAFALALAVVFGVSFALYKPERIEAAAQETMDDETTNGSDTSLPSNPSTAGATRRRTAMITTSACPACRCL